MTRKQSSSHSHHQAPQLRGGGGGAAGIGGASAAGVVQLDKSVAWALLSLALVYSIVTVVTYQHVAASDIAATTISSSSSSAVSTMANHNNYHHPNEYSIHALQHESFPLHVDEETTEIIEHPGAPYIKPDAFPDDVNTRSLRVPMFFDKAYGIVYDNHGHSIRRYLGNFGRRLITKQEASSIGSFDRHNRETIYASVASYRDPECTGTVTDLFERAEYPQRVRVAIVEQRLAQDTVCTTPPADCTAEPKQALCRYAHLIDYYEMDARLGVGPVFARHLAHRHYRGGESNTHTKQQQQPSEQAIHPPIHPSVTQHLSTMHSCLRSRALLLSSTEYFAMQIDSHVRFTEHWDTDIIGQWKSAKNESKSVI